MGIRLKKFFEKLVKKIFKNNTEEKRIADESFGAIQQNEYISKYTSIYVGIFGHLSTLENELIKAGFKNVPAYLKVGEINNHDCILTGFGKTSGYAIVYTNIFGNKSICINKSITRKSGVSTIELYGDDTETVGIEAYSWWYGTDDNRDIFKDHDCEIISAK